MTMRLLAEARRRGRGSKTRSRTEVIVWRMDLDGAVLLFTGASITPPAALRDLPPPDSWLWTWEARAPSGEGKRGSLYRAYAGRA